MDNINTKEFSPCQILKVYKQEYSDKYYIEIHNIMKSTEGDYTLAPGRPLQKKTMQRLLGSVKDIDPKLYFEKKLINPYLLACEPIKYKRYILWYSPAGPKSMIFTKGVKTKDAVYMMPALLYFINLDKFKIFAMKTDKQRPTMSAELYTAPIFNQVGHNTICWGSVKKDTSNINSINAEIDVWENYLWKSKFDSTGNSGTTKLTLNELYKQVKVEKNLVIPKFPHSTLIKCNMEIRDIFNNYIS